MIPREDPNSTSSPFFSETGPLTVAALIGVRPSSVASSDMELKPTSSSPSVNEFSSSEKDPEDGDADSVSSGYTSSGERLSG